MHMKDLLRSKLGLGFFSLLVPVALVLSSCVSSEQSVYALEDHLASVSEKVLPGIVELNALVVKDLSNPNDMDAEPFFDFFFDNPEGEEASPKREFKYQSLGSGVIFYKKASDYFVVTNLHVIGEAKTITVKLEDGREFPASVVNIDKRKDIAVVTFKSEDALQLVPLGDSDKLKPGNLVLALGSPYGFQSSVTLGIVSALHRRGGPSDNINDFIQTDASINQGNSGGALINSRGELVGINTWISSQTGDNVGLGFSIPINNIKKEIFSFARAEKMQDAWLGVYMQSVDLALAKQYGLSLPRGILIISVYPESPAYKAGLRPGDLVLEADGRILKSYEDLVQKVLETDVEANMVLKVQKLNSSTTTTLRVPLAPRLKDETLASQTESLWPAFFPYPNTEISLGESKDLKGLLVREVLQGSIMQKIGLKTRDVIVSVAGKAVNTVPELFSAFSDKLQPGLEIELWRNGQKITLIVPENT